MERQLVTRRTVSLLVIACIGSGLLSLALGQDRNWDLRNYHFYNAYSLINDRLDFDIAPAQIQTYHNPVLDLPFYALLRHSPPQVYGLIVGCVHGLNWILIYLISMNVITRHVKKYRKLLSAVFATTGYFGAANFSEIGTTFHDNTTSVFILAGVLTLVTVPTRERGSQWPLGRWRLLGAGLLMGLAAGLKLPSALYAAALPCAVLVVLPTWRSRIRGSLTCSAGVMLGVAASLGYWMIVLWDEFRNPLFPYFNSIFRSPYYELVNFRDERFLPRDLSEMIFYPFHFVGNSRLVNELPFFDLRFVICYIVVAICGLMALWRVFAKRLAIRERRRELSAGFFESLPARFVVIFFVVSYVVWQSMFSIYRYLVPLELVAPVLWAVILGELFSSARVALQATVVLCAVSLVTLTPIDWGREPWTDEFFGVQVPDLSDLEDATVIIADGRPVSYVVPFFPETTRFVSVRNNFLRPEMSNLLQERVRSVLAASGGRLYLLGGGGRQQDYGTTLGFYFLMLDGEIEIALPTKLDDDLVLASVSRIR